MKIVLATGGSGGHIIPALYVADQLKAMDHQVILAGELERQRALWESRGYAGQHFAVKGLKTNSLSALLDFAVSMVKSIFVAYGFLRREHAVAVLGFGGYGAVPVVVAAFLRRTPIMIHEQNVKPGKANSLMSKVADRVAVSFTASQGYFRRELTMLTGCPCRPPLMQRFDMKHRIILRQKFGLDRDRSTILVMGGSQGSATINQIAPAALSALNKEIDVQVIHLAGVGQDQSVQNFYQEQKIPHAVFGFLNRIEEAYAVADVAVSRAGAVTLHELDAYQMPAVIIPYPYAGAHQQANAEALAAAGNVEILKESDLTADGLAALLNRCVNRAQHKAKVVAAQEESRSFRPQTTAEGSGRVYRSDAAQRIADGLINLIESEQKRPRR